MQSERYADILSGVSIFVAHYNAEIRRGLRSLLRCIGAEVSSSRSALEANIKYLKMHKSGEIPNRIVTEWWLEDPDSDTFQFWDVIGRPQQNSAYELLESVRDLDDGRVDVTIYSHDLQSAIDSVSRFHSMNIETCCPSIMSPLDLVLNIATQENIKLHRTKALHDIQMARGDAAWISQMRRFGDEVVSRIDGTTRIHTLTPTV